MKTAFSYHHPYIRFFISAGHSHQYHKQQYKKRSKSKIFYDKHQNYSSCSNTSAIPTPYQVLIKSMFYPSQTQTKPFCKKTDPLQTGQWQNMDLISTWYGAGMEEG
jgi:hypothetical protein